MLAPKIVLPGRDRLNEYSVCVPYGSLGSGIRRSLITTSDRHQSWAAGFVYSVKGRYTPFPANYAPIKEKDLYGFRINHQCGPLASSDFYNPDNATLFSAGVAVPGAGIGTAVFGQVQVGPIIAADGTVTASISLRNPNAFSTYIIGGSFKVVLGSVYAVAIVFQSGQPTKLWVNGVQDPITGTLGSNLPVNGANYINGLNGLFACLYTRVLTANDIGVLSADPFRFVHTPSRRNTSFLAAPASVSLPTLVQPASTTSPGGWTATGAASLHAAINEVTPSSAEYISVASASTTELVLAESAHPGGANQKLAYWASSLHGSSLTVTLKQGVTTIMTRTHALTSTGTLYTQTLTAPEIALITAGAISVTLTTS